MLTFTLMHWMAASDTALAEMLYETPVLAGRVSDNVTEFMLVLLPAGVKKCRDAALALSTAAGVVSYVVIVLFDVPDVGVFVKPVNEIAAAVPAPTAADENRYVARPSMSRRSPVPPDGTPATDEAVRSA